jgi:hypothetical protein
MGKGISVWHVIIALIIGGIAAFMGFCRGRAEAIPPKEEIVNRVIER